MQKSPLDFGMKSESIDRSFRRVAVAVAAPEDGIRRDDSVRLFRVLVAPPLVRDDERRVRETTTDAVCGGGHPTARRLDAVRATR